MFEEQQERWTEVDVGNGGKTAGLPSFWGGCRGREPLQQNKPLFVLQREALSPTAGPAGYFIKSTQSCWGPLTHHQSVCECTSSSVCFFVAFTPDKPSRKSCKCVFGFVLFREAVIDSACMYIYIDCRGAKRKFSLPQTISSLVRSTNSLRRASLARQGDDKQKRAKERDVSGKNILHQSEGHWAKKGSAFSARVCKSDLCFWARERVWEGVCVWRTL